MADIKKSKNFMPKTPDKPNFQLWLIVTAVIVLVGITWFNQRNTVINITKSRFEDIYLASDVAKVMIIRNQNRIDVTLKETALQNEKYKSELEANSPFFNPTGPHYSIEVASAEKFEKDFEELES